MTVSRREFLKGLGSVSVETRLAIALADAELAQQQRTQPNKVQKPGDRLTDAVKANVRLQT
ncbi:hypothetical protein [Thermoleptolyngbya sp.]